MVRVMLLLAWVSCSARATRSVIFLPTGAMPPPTRRRMPLRCSFSASRSSAMMNSCFSIDTSSAGRRQFSELNANSVRYSTPRATHALTTSRTISTPRLCPAARGSMRCLAQRPLPSMMIAIWRGTAFTCGIARVELGKEGINVSVWVAPGSDRHQVGLFGGDQFVGELLDFVLRAALIVLGNGLLLEQIFEVVVGVAPQISHRHLGILAFALDHRPHLLFPG